VRLEIRITFALPKHTPARCLEADVFGTGPTAPHRYAKVMA
jgi:hypothetical protein